MKSFLSTNRYLLGTALFIAALSAAQPASAQGPGSGGPTPTAVPIDGGASLLLAAGAAYGLKRLRAARKR
ncbi:PID-CTERM protein-sorting domain-containing protein [uncultured Hymenobacter sp.]|uniref:PID-CTERM protein-sorting domain-containing protein n=1 Tax=uncultured Hymenobacter sp. TaxID=170016 RepID=UPI0035CB75DB